MFLWYAEACASKKLIRTFELRACSQNSVGCCRMRTEDAVQKSLVNNNFRNVVQRGCAYPTGFDNYKLRELGLGITGRWKSTRTTIAIAQAESVQHAVWCQTEPR